MIKKFLENRLRVVMNSFVLFVLLVTCVLLMNKANNSIKVTGEVNNLFTNDYFNNLFEIEDVFRQLSIDENDKLQLICQALSELSLTKVEVSETNPVLIKTGHSFYRFNYSDGSYRILAILGNQIIVDDKEVYEAQEDINSIIQEQLVSQGE